MFKDLRMTRWRESFFFSLLLCSCVLDLQSFLNFKTLYSGLSVLEVTGLISRERL